MLIVKVMVDFAEYYSREPSAEDYQTARFYMEEAGRSEYADTIVKNHGVEDTVLRGLARCLHMIPPDWPIEKVQAYIDAMIAPQPNTGA